MFLSENAVGAVVVASITTRAAMLGTSPVPRTGVHTSSTAINFAFTLAALGDSVAAAEGYDGGDVVELASAAVTNQHHRPAHVHKIFCRWLYHNRCS